MRQRKRTGQGEPVFNPKRRLRSWSGDATDLAFGRDLALKVRYTGSPAHKRNPGDFHLTPPAAARPNATLCDEAQIFRKAEAVALLRAGATKGLVDDRGASGFPLLIWAVSGAGIAFEAELENAERGEYHGYPMPTSDPLRREILNAWRAR